MRVAVPYYGAMIRPGAGLERVYFLVDVDPAAGSFRNLGMHIWDSRAHPEFPTWLSRKGVQGLICGDDRPAYEGVLKKAGIWVRWGKAGDLEDLVGGMVRDRAA
ncbi:MAG: hypothetical protein C0617_08270 [Desulfuromonas sp.]|uniref:NifB/NifX family molybdenum-iron cluster-binding protein n=1 Tax=Desulfuromonas sp. TaxID=892 RepID=UPI000CC4ECE4|nr:hypothetical protein [Desulfuromonas sp.]PLX84362.1 MAG: hypothetical protein C0617_08270 [Desulfuromonas sp.]